jgi:hypothetical protein
MRLVDRSSGADGTAGAVDVFDARGDRFAVARARAGAEAGAKLRRQISQSNEPRQELSSREILVSTVQVGS